MICRSLIAMAIVLIAGCSTSWEQTSIVHPAELTLGQIQTIQLEHASTSAPVTVEVATSQPAATQPASVPQVQLSLEEVRAAALANNLDLKIELIAPSIAQQDVDFERAKFEATFFSSAMYNRQDDSTSAVQRTQNYTAGIRAPLITGGNARVSVPYEIAEGDNDRSYQSGLQFSISQPLLRDAGISVNTTSIRIAEYQRKIVDAQTKLQAIRILANADRGYWFLYSARRSLEISRQQYDLAIRQVDQAQKRFAAQASPRIEITRAESGAASRLAAIIIAETNVRQAERDLKRIMQRADLPIDSDTAIIPYTNPNPIGLVLSPSDLATHAVSNRMEMLELELRLAQDASNINFARNQTLPLFALDFDYKLLHSSNRSGESFDFNRGGNLTDWSAGVRAEIPLGNHATKAQLNRAILERIQRLGTRQQQQQAIIQEVYDAIDQFNETWQRILAARNESVLAGRTYDAELRQFELDVRTSTDVLDAAGRLASAQLREIDALADYEIASVNIAFATGTLLGHGHVVLHEFNQKL